MGAITDKHSNVLPVMASEAEVIDLSGGDYERTGGKPFSLRCNAAGTVYVDYYEGGENIKLVVESAGPQPVLLKKVRQTGTDLTTAGDLIAEF